MFNLECTPYSLSDAAAVQVKERLATIEDRVSVLRSHGTLNDQTLKQYYGERRFEQVAESNALEGSTLSVGETELAVLTGVTITGHDPGYVRDAIALDKALSRITEIAREKEPPTGITQLREVQALLLEDRPGAGIFRRERVTIRGSRHIPPKSWQAIMSQMEQWENWSVSNATLPAPIRSMVLHAWLTHVHPYIDGNGRTARAIGNLELIRAGYPPIIIKKVERERYLDALGESDEGGDIRSFIELVFDRIEGALTGLERSASKHQDLNPALERIRQLQQKQLGIWEMSVRLLASIIEHNVLNKVNKPGGTCRMRVFAEPLDLQDYEDLCNGRSIPRSWAFTIQIAIPGLPTLEKLAFVGLRSSQMSLHFGQECGPSLYWSARNPDQFPRWGRTDANSPYAVEMTTAAGIGDAWSVRRSDDTIQKLQTTELAAEISDALLAQATNAIASIPRD